MSISSTVGPLEQAGLPSAIAVVKAMQAFVANLGTDPAQVPLKFPGAATVFIGTLQMQLPILAVSEFGAAQAAVNAQLSGLVAKLEALRTPVPAPAPIPVPAPAPIPVPATGS